MEDFKEFLAQAFEDRGANNQAEKIRRRGATRHILTEMIAAPALMCAYMGVGAVMGEIADQLPYVGETVSDTLNKFTNSSSFKENLESVGATLGFAKYIMKK